MEPYAITSTTEDGIEIWGENCKIGDIVQTHTRNDNVECVEEVIGFVCGIIYHDGNEWLYATNDLAATSQNRCRKEEKTKILKTQEKALEHLRKFKKWEKCKRFIRPYIYDHPKRA